MIYTDQTKPKPMAGNMAPARILHGTGNTWLDLLIGSFKLIKTTSASLCWSWVAKENLDGNTAEGLQEMLLLLVSDIFLKTLQGKEEKQWPACQIMKELEKTPLLRNRVGKKSWKQHFFPGFSCKGGTCRISTICPVNNNYKKNNSSLISPRPWEEVAQHHDLMLLIISCLRHLQALVRN